MTSSPSGAQELRQGHDLPTVDLQGEDTISAMPIEMFLDYLANRLNAEKAGGRNLTINLRTTKPDTDHEPGSRADADATVTLSRSTLNDLMSGKATVQQLAEAGDAAIDGDPAGLADLGTCSTTSSSGSVSSRPEPSPRAVAGASRATTPPDPTPDVPESASEAVPASGEGAAT